LGGGLALLAADQLRDHTGQKRRYWLGLKEIIRAAPPFFSACAGMVLVNNTSARKKSRREIGGPAQRSATASGSPESGSESG
jgi:hypothetical protein